MSTELRPIDAADLTQVDTPTLKAELAGGLARTAGGLLHVARVAQELTRRGENLSGLRSGLRRYLPLIASGAVSAEVVVSFAGQPTLLRAIAGLPIDDQQRLSGPEPDPVLLVVREGGKLTHRMLPPAALTVPQIRQVFGDRHIRTEVEQIALVSEARAAPEWTPGRPIRKGQVTVDRTAAEVRIGKSRAPLADVIAALKAAGVTI